MRPKRLYLLYKIKKNTKTVKLSKLNGLIILADLEDNIFQLHKYENGKKLLPEINSSNKKGRPSSCWQSYMYEYYTYEGIDCGQNCRGVELTLNREERFYEVDCGGANGENNGGGGGTGPGSNGNNSTNPNDEVPIDPPYIRPIDRCLLAGGDGNAQNQLGQEIANVLTATGLAADITGWSLDKAEAMARSLGAQVTDFTPAWRVLGKSVGFVSLAVDGVQLGISLSDGDWTSGDGLNAAQTLLSLYGSTAALGFIAAGPITLVVVGSISVGLAIYSASCD